MSPPFAQGLWMTLGDRSVRRIGAETLRPRPAVSGLPAGGRVEHAAIL